MSKKFTYHAGMWMNDAGGGEAVPILKQAFDGLPVSVFLLDPLGRVMYANSAALAIAGYSSEEIVHIQLQAIIQFAPEEFTGTYERLLRNGGHPVSNSGTIINKTGSQAEVNLQLSLVSENGNRYLLVYVTEVEKREGALKRANKLLQSSIAEKTEALSTILERITDGITAFDMDWNYTYINGNAAMMIDKKPEEIIGRNVWEVFPEIVGSSLYQKYKLAIEEQTVIRTEEYVDSLQKWFEGVLYPSPQGLSVFFQDITDKKNVQLALEERELLYRTIVETSQEGIWQIDALNRTTFVNEHLSALLGYTRQEMIGRPFIDFMDAEAKAGALGQVEERKKGIATQHEFTFLRKNGTPLYTLLQSSPILRNGNYEGAVAMVIDNTERKKVEERLKASERRFRALFEHSKDGIALLSETGVIMNLSPAIETILGLSKEALLGTTRLDFIHSDDIHIIYEAVAEVVSEPLKSKTVEYRAITPAGIHKWIEGTYTNLLSEPAVGAIVLNFRDITERKSTENKLKESEAKYRKAQSQGKLGHWEWDPVTNRLLWSDEIYTMFGVVPDGHSTHYENFLNCIHPEDRGHVEATIGEALALGNGYELLTRIIIEENSIRHVYILAETIKEDSGRVVKVIGMVQDVTTQKALEKELSVSEKNYRLLFERSPVPFWMVEYPSFDFLEVNQAAIDLYGYSKEKFLCLNVRDIQPGRAESNVHQNSFEGPDGLPQSTAKHVKSNGEEIIVHLTTSQMMYRGKKVWLASTRDITLELLYEKRLKENEQQLSLIFNSSINGMALFEVEEGEFFRFEAVNSALCSGLRIEQEEMVGRLLNEVFEWEDIQPLLPHYQKTVASGEVQSFVVQSRRRIGSRTVECTAIPIKNEMGRVIKVLSVSNDITERKKAEDDLLQKNIELRQLSAHLENIREEERTKMSREIHDELGQQLTGLKMEVSWLNRHFKGQDQKTLLKIKSCLGLIDDTIQSVKRIATMLRPSILDHLGLAEALDWQGAEFSKHTGVPLSFQTAVSETKFPPVLSIAVFRVFQEALTNVARHANATEVSCTLKVESGTLHLIVTDNGKGFSTQSWTQRRTLGLLGMRERVEMLHGRFTIHSVPGEGTTICAEIPLN